MKNTRTAFTFLLLVCTLLGCQIKELFEGPDFFEDDFENYLDIVDALEDNDKFWSYTQLTKDQNRITVDTSRAYSGTKALKFEAEPSDAEVSKTSLAKQNMAFWEGETVRLSAMYYIEGNAPLEWLFLMDIEEQAQIGAGPGMRLALVDDKLRVEYKFNEKDITQASGQEIDFPRNQWVEIIWEVKLSTKTEGEVRLWQDGVQLINTTNNTTLPQDVLYFQQGTKGMYSSCEIGITANSKDSPLTLWVDRVKFEVIN